MRHICWQLASSAGKNKSWVSDWLRKQRHLIAALQNESFTRFHRTEPKKSCYLTSFCLSASFCFKEWIVSSQCEIWDKKYYRLEIITLMPLTWNVYSNKEDLFVFQKYWLQFVEVTEKIRNITISRFWRLWSGEDWMFILVENHQLNKIKG